MKATKASSASERRSLSENGDNGEPKGENMAKARR
jgi:hypothetical protein